MKKKYVKLDGRKIFHLLKKRDITGIPMDQTFCGIVLCQYDTKVSEISPFKSVCLNCLKIQKAKEYK